MIGGRKLAQDLEPAILGYLEDLKEKIGALEAPPADKNLAYHHALLFLSRKAYEASQKQQTTMNRAILKDLVGIAEDDNE